MINTSRFLTKQTKTLILQDEGTLVTKIVQAVVIVDKGSINLMQSLNEILSDVKSKKIRCYDFSQDTYIEINASNCLVPISFMANNPSNIILLKISRAEEQSSHYSTNSLFSQQNDGRSQNSSIKKERSKQRVIFQVIEIVKKWRQLHYAKNDCKKKSLHEAALMIGMPKKSLDDYYYQLRLGQKYDFDFKAHLFDRIGVLRSFLKNIRQSPLYDRNQKHPKKLKILDQFQALSQRYNGNLPQRKINQQPDCIQFQEQQEQQNQEVNIRENNGEYQSPVQIYEQGMSEQQSNKNVYNTFFNDFEYLMNDKDPFLSLDYDFKKKDNNGCDDYFQF